jgi:predicted GTPase
VKWVVDAVYQFYQSVKEYFFIQNTKWLVRLINEHDDCLNHKKLRHQKTELNYWVDNLDKPIKIFVVGEGNFGKSTLINAIIQGAVAPVNFLPTTWCIHRYLPGENRAELYYAGGEKVQATIEEARECITAEEKRQKNDPSYISQLCQVDWYYSQYPVLNKFVLVDTPGLFQVRLDRIKKSIEEYYYQADAVLWLFDATKINRENSYKALRQVSRFSKKIIGVINKWDMVSAGSQERILRQAQDSFGEYVPIFQPVSAKQAWLAVEKQQSGLYEES